MALLFFAPVQVHVHPDLQVSNTFGSRLRFRNLVRSSWYVRLPNSHFAVLHLSVPSEQFCLVVHGYIYIVVVAEFIDSIIYSLQSRHKGGSCDGVVCIAFTYDLFHAAMEIVRGCHVAPPQKGPWL
jgi:hypothetical protein